MRKFKFISIGLIVIFMTLSGVFYFDKQELREQIKSQAVLEQEIKSLEIKSGVAEIWEGRYDQMKLEKEGREKEIAQLKVQLSRKLFADWVKGDKNFSSMSELHSFLSRVDVNKIRYQATLWDCEDQAFFLMREGAYEDYAIYPILIFSFQGNHLTGKHLTTFAIVNMDFLDMGVCDVFVWIEPTTLEVRIIGRADDKSTWMGKYAPFLP